jgi:hypothetical protein
MAQRANITSVEALKAFRSNLLVYLSKARPALEEAGSEVQRVRIWLENDQRTFWTGQLKRAMRQLEEAEGAMFSAKLSKVQTVSAAQQAAVHKARRLVSEAEEKLRRLKKWDKEFENQTQPLLKKTEKLSNLLAVDIPNAVAHLTGVIDTLEKYASIAAPEAAGAATPAGGAASEPEAAGGKGGT